MKNDLETIKKEIRGLVSELAEIPVKDLKKTTGVPQHPEI